MDCFFQLRGLQDVVITGNLADAYVGRLTYSMKRPELVPRADPLDTKLPFDNYAIPVRRQGHKTSPLGCFRLAV